MLVDCCCLTPESMRLYASNRMNTHTFRIIIEPDGKFFHAYVPALSGCHTFGRTLVESQRRVREAIAAYVDSLLADGKRVPSDESFESFETITLPRQREYA